MITMRMPKSSSSIAIELKNVSKTYTIHHEKPTLVETLGGKNRETFTALDHVSLTIKKGERVGIIGPNGSGKTTLLKIIAGITTPTSGTVKTHGRIVSLIDLEAGFHPDLTGIQNIFLNGMLLGMKKEEIDGKLKRIINFADIGTFIDAPLYTYSNGMKLRLGFAIAVHVNLNILILDEEALSVGDKIFNHKYKKEIENFSRKNKTIIVVSHWLQYIKKNSKHILLMQKGKIIEGGGKLIISKYLKDTL